VLAKKKKLSKKQIKEDKLVTTFYQAQSFYEQYQTKIIIGVAAVAVVVLAVLFYTSKVNENNLAATTQLSRVLPLYNAGAYQESIDGRPGTNVVGLAEIAENYGGTEQGELARVYLANAQYFLGNVDAALENYEDYSGSNKDLVASALAGAAACYEAKDDFAKAAKNFYKAANISKYNPQNAEYLLAAGINYLKTNDKKTAKEVFEIIKNDYKTTQTFSQVERYLAQVN